MMHHIDEGTLQALLDGELPDAAGTTARDHLSTCAACSESYASVRRNATALSEALALLDVPARSARPLRSPPSMTRRARWGAGALPRAALLLLTTAAVASAAIPGSPVRGWLERQLGSDAPVVALDAEAERHARPTALALEAPAESGVTVDPVDGRLRFVLLRAGPDVQVRARLTDSPRGGVFAVGDAVDASFRTAAGTIEVADARSGELRVEIPRTAHSAVVEVDGTAYVVKEGDRLQLVGEGGVGGAGEVVFRVQP